MSPTELALYERIRRRASLLQPDLSKRLLYAYEVIRQSLTEAELAQAIRDGRIEMLLDELLTEGLADPAFSPLRQTIDQAVVDAARTEYGKQVQTGVFDTLNPRVLQAAKDLDTRAIQTLKVEVRETVRQRVMSGLNAGENPRATARGIKSVIGLSPRQELYVANFRRELETGDRAALNRVLGRGVIRTPDGTLIVRRAHADQQGLTATQLQTLGRNIESLKPAQIDSMTEAYRRRMLALNAETQTRTIALDAMRAGARGSWEDAIAQGIVNRTDLRRTWVAVDDNRTRPEHRAMDGTTVEFDTPYPNGEMIPGESTYNCRCIERVTIAREALIAA